MPSQDDGAIAEGFLLLALDDLRSGLDVLPMVEAAADVLRFAESGKQPEALEELGAWLVEEQEERSATRH